MLWLLYFSISEYCQTQHSYIQLVIFQEWNRHEYGINIFFNIGFILTNITPIIVETCNLFPRLFFLIFTLLTTCLAIYIFFTNTKKLVLRNSIEFIVLIIVCIMSSFITFLLGLTSFWTGRLRFSIGTTIGLLYIFYIVELIYLKKRN